MIGVTCIRDSTIPCSLIVLPLLENSKVLPYQSMFIGLLDSNQS